MPTMQSDGPVLWVRRGFLFRWAAAILTVAGLSSLGLRLLWAGEGHDHGGGGGNAMDINTPRVISDVTHETLGIQTAPAMTRTIEEVVRVTGTVRAKPDLTARVNSPIAGRIREVAANVGGHVKSGDVLATLDSIEAVKLQNALTVQAGRQRETRRHLEETKDVARRLAVAELTALHAQYRVAEDALGFSEQNLELVRRGGAGIPRKDVLAAETDRSRAAVLVQTLESRMAVAGLGAAALAKVRAAGSKPDFTAMLADGSLNWEEVSVLGKPLEVLDREHEQIEVAAEVQRLTREVRVLGFDEATVKGLSEGKLEAQPLLLKAPIGGTVTARNAVLGQNVQTEQALLDIVDTSKVYVDAEVPESVLAKVRSRNTQVARIRSVTLPGVILEGRIVHLSPAVNATSRTAQVVIEVDNPDGKLLIGAFVEASLVIRKVKDALTVPRDAVVRQGPMTFVWVEGRHGSDFEYGKRDVLVGAADDLFVEIAKGDLAPGVHRVVSFGGYQLTLMPGKGGEHEQGGHAGHNH